MKKSLFFLCGILCLLPAACRPVPDGAVLSPEAEEVSAYAPEEDSMTLPSRFSTSFSTKL